MASKFQTQRKRSVKGGVLNKVRQLEELSALVPEGASVALGGAWFSNHPMAAVRQLIRAGRQDLKAIALVASIDVDLLVGARALRHLTFSMVTLEAFGLAGNFRRAVQQGELPITEISALSLQIALEAGGNSIPFQPLRGPVGSDLVPLYPDVYGTASSSFGEGEVPVVKAIRPDVAIVHATRCDPLGNCQHDGTYGMDPELARASDHVIVTCEEIVSTEEIEEMPSLTRISGFLVDAVIEAPFGAHPCSHVPRYVQDAWWLMDYQRSALAGGDEYSELIATLRDEDEDSYRARTLGDDRGQVLEALVNAAAILDPETA